MLVRWQKDGVEEDRVHLIAGDSGDEDHEDARESGSDIQQDSPQRGSELGKERRRVAKTPRIVYVIAFFSIIGGFLFGYDTSVIAGALLELDRDFHLDATQKELVVSITVAAAALGAVCGGPLNEIVGRKKTIMVASVVFALGAVVMAGAPPASWGWSVVLIGRFIVGISIGESDTIGSHVLYPIGNAYFLYRLYNIRALSSGVCYNYYRHIKYDSAHIPGRVCPCSFARSSDSSRCYGSHRRTVCCHCHRLWL